MALVRLELSDVLVAGVPPARPPELTEALLHTVNVVALEPVAKFVSHNVHNTTNTLHYEIHDLYLFWFEF